MGHYVVKSYTCVKGDDASVCAVKWYSCSEYSCWMWNHSNGWKKL